ncbi:hypothetical protein C5614_11865 [Massilia phosphatilytica]|nr:hypothetical protein C5614_11865 [Massilia phosphatilytica]
MQHKKFSAIVAVLAGLTFGQAGAQQNAPANPPNAASGQAQVKWSTDSLVGDLLDYAPAKAILVKHMPAIAQDDQIEQARGMTFRSLQQFAPDAITDALLAALDADLAKLPPQQASATKP